MTKLEFGAARDFAQAQLRLPDSQHPSYPADEVIVHLADLREHLDILSSLYQKDAELFQEHPLAERLVPLTLSDLLFLERIAYKRKFPPIVLKEHETLMTKNIWDSIFPSGDEAYGWWEVYEMSPELKIPDHMLICMMYNSSQGTAGYPPQFHRLDSENWQIELGVVSKKDLYLLVSDLEK